MNTENKKWISDKAFFWLVLGISLVVPAVVAALKFLPEDYRPNALFAMHLPKLNAVLNSMVSIVLLAGFVAIRYSAKRGLHKALMLTAFLLSAMFLVSYVIYHSVMPSTPYCQEGAMKTLYLTILISHVILAAAILPMVLYTIYFSTTGKYEKHKKIARWTFPLWLYVSVTGVVVYVLISPCYSF
jgi:putative membrane protein